MRVFLGNSPWRKKGFYGVRAGSRWPHFEEASHDYMPFPFFLAYAAAVLEEYDHEVLLVDGIAEGISEKDFIKRVLSFLPDLIVLEVSTISMEVDLALSRKLRKTAGEDVKIAFCGLHAYMYQPEFLEKHAFLDFILVGEYEYTLRDLAAHLEKGQSLEKVTGLIFREAGGNVMANPRRPLISNLDELPWPARQHLPMKNYHDEPGNIPRPSVQIQASRGCPFGCVFCAWPQIIYGSRKYRTRDPMDVVNEFEWLVKTCGFKSVYFDDDTFNIGESRILSICKGLKERRLETPWAAMCRADTMTPEMLESMVASGLHAVKYGVETADQSILKAIGKHLNIEKVKKTIQRTHELGVKTHLTFMFGLPGETRETARKTIELALALNPESLQFSIATPFPGSHFFNCLEKQELIRHQDFSRYDGFRSAVVRTESLSSEDLEEIVVAANASWQRNVLKRTSPKPIYGDDGFASVIIPNFNGKAFLKACLDSLTQQTKRNIEIILVDNGSTDGSIELVNTHYPKVKIISLPFNTGFATAVNQGIKKAKGSFIAVLNNDTIVSRDWLDVLCDYLEGNPHIGFCASKITQYDNPKVFDSVGNGLMRSGRSFNVAHGVRDTGQYDNFREVFGASASAAVYRRAMLDDIGLFDEDFFMYLEDVDLSFRAQLRGHKCMYVPRANVRHHGAGTTGSQYHKDNVYFIARNTIYVLLKDMPKQILKSHCFHIFGFIFYLQMYHTFRSSHAWSCLKGLCRGLKDARRMMVKRKRILGGKRISDVNTTELLLSCEAEYRRFKRKNLKND